MTRILALATALLLALLVAACGSDADPTATPAPTVAPTTEATAAATSAETAAASATAATAALSFIDDRIVTFEPGAEPRIVAEASVAAALLEYGVTLTGVFGQLEDAAGNPYGGADFSGIASVGGAAYGEINLEALTELDPDVIVTIAWGPDSVWWINDDIVDEVTAIAPLLIVAVSDGTAGIPAPRIIARFDELSLVLGGTGAPAASRARYEAAEAAVVAAAAAHPDITLMFASAGTDTFYVADPPAWPDLSYYVELGVTVLRTETTEGGFWEYLSLESIDKYDVDYVLLDDRDPEQRARLDADVPLWPTLPAVQADQVTLWPIAGRVYTYDGIAVVLDKIAAVIEGATDVS
ncbi:MAG: ABC transporter substrate-binding protein [Chloroflexi bacterium]|nr:ABC transporter substrate-binding protein [Chloroflexota bacterium]MDA1147672.1 ABC transporter substrate-binding protein [Chloroflexota bacterium]